MVSVSILSTILIDVSFSIWYGVQSAIGGQCMFVMLRAMWPTINNIRKLLAVFKTAQRADLRNILSEWAPWVCRHHYRRDASILFVLACLLASNLVPDSPNVRCLCSVRRKYSPLLFSRHLFTVKAIITPIAGIIFFVWCIVKAKGVGPIIRQPGAIHGSELGWGMITNLMSCISNMATLVTSVSSTLCHRLVMTHVFQQ